MNLLILYAKNKGEILNRKSALGSYIFNLSKILNSNSINVFVNGIKFSKLNQVYKNEPINKIEQSNFKKSVKNLIPQFIKRYIKEKKNLSSINKMTSDLLNSTQKYDAILEFYTLGSNVGYELSKSLSIPLYITYDSPIFEEYKFFNHSKPFNYKYLKDIEKKSLLQAEKIVVYSNPMKAYISQITKYDNNVFIHQNIDFSRFDIMTKEKPSTKKEINICFIGSFLKWHQVDFLVDAFENLLLNGINANLFLVGDGMERQTIENYVQTKTNEVKSKINFTGFLDGETLLILKTQMHIGIMPGSNWYGAPNKIFEYGAMKMAVLVPDTPTIKDLFTENEITFFEWKSKNSLKDKLLVMCSNSELIQKKSSALNRFIINNHSQKQTLDFYNTIFHS
ncbi:MAG TPA: glycosyltransferase family 1 protein [Crocinitomix sp.]|nr:glycosyltransferase family 1 protein [Crocinitomix sp.]